MKYLFTYNGNKFHESDTIPPLNELVKILRNYYPSEYINQIEENKIKYYKQF